MKPLQTSFDGLISPEHLTQELSILLAILYISMLYASFKLRSLLGLFGWVLMNITLILSIFTQFPLMWFWLMVIVESLILVLSGIEYTKVASS